MKRSVLAATLILAYALSFSAEAASVPQTVPGAFALAGGTPEVAGALTATPAGKDKEALDFVIEKPGTSQPITAFDVELTKEMHVIAVSDDLKTFIHDHVKQVSADGHFRLTMVFPRPALYHIYADTAPTGLGHQVLRFDLPVGGDFAHAPAALTPSGLEVASGPYSVKFASLDLKAGGETMLQLQILKNGVPAPDLKPFLGVPAHAVFISAATLDYIHAHPMAMNGQPDTNLMLHVEAPQPGLYALWIQFNAGGKLRTVPFVAVAK